MEDCDWFGSCLSQFVCLKVFQFVMRSMYFLFDGQFYKQVDGVVMGSLLSRVVANFCKEAFEKAVL